MKELRIETKFNKLVNNLGIRLIKETKNCILNIPEYITSRKNLKIDIVDLSLKNKSIAYCFELPLGIISFSSFVNIVTTNIFSLDLEMNKLLANNPDKLFYCCLNKYYQKHIK